jgi:hypothetical protein
MWKSSLTTFYIGLFLSSVICPSYLHAAQVDSEIVQAYKRSDYKAAADLVEYRIYRIQKEAPGSAKAPSQNLYSDYLLLAYIYAWKLGDLDKGLKVYQKATVIRSTDDSLKGLPSVEGFYIAEIYEREGDLSRAKEQYLSLLKGLTEVYEKEHDDVSSLVGKDLIDYVRYQLDGISLKEKQKDFRPLLPKIKLSSVTTRLTLTQFLAMIFVPRIELELAMTGREDLRNHLKQTSADLGNVFLEFSLIINSSAGSVTAESEEAMRAYLLKYPDSYWSFLLGGAFYKFYKQNEQNDKADRLLKDLMRMAKKRSIELVTSPDKRFSSPEVTWKNYKNALKQGDMETAMECYLPGQRKHRQVFNALGAEKMRELGETMGEIEKIRVAENEAKYRIKRLENGKEITYFIDFYNIDGEWKMREF